MSEDDPFDEPSEGSGSDDAGTEGSLDDEPLGDLRRDVESRTESGESGDEDLFASVAVDDVDLEEVWTDVLLGEEPTEGSVPPTAVEAGGDVQVVNKRLCHRCRHFGDPPTLECTHEGTAIHETVDMDHYRVSNCPMVDTEADPYRSRE
ncbi:MAG: hypothetical protein ABEJ76_07935 [Halanaeroarchaeum sp.]